jgi:hypothetical protein
VIELEALEVDIPPGPPQITAKLSPDSSAEQRIEAWFELLDFGHQFTRLWFQQRFQPGQRVDDVVREWYKREQDEHEASLIAMMRRLSEAEAACRSEEEE